MQLKVKLLGPTAKAPERAHEEDGPNGSVGYDCFCYGNHTISPGELKKIPLGFAAELPPGYAALFWDKSGYALRGINISGGLIDPNYRDYWSALLTNNSGFLLDLPHGTKIVQFVIQKCELLPVVIVEELSETSRGTGGYGSTGLNTKERIHTSGYVRQIFDTPKEAAIVEMDVKKLSGEKVLANKESDAKKLMDDMKKIIESKSDAVEAKELEEVNKRRKISGYPPLEKLE